MWEGSTAAKTGVPALNCSTFDLGLSDEAALSVGPPAYSGRRAVTGYVHSDDRPGPRHAVDKPSRRKGTATCSPSGCKQHCRFFGRCRFLNRPRHWREGHSIDTAPFWLACTVPPSPRLAPRVAFWVSALAGRNLLSGLVRPHLGLAAPCRAYEATAAGGHVLPYVEGARPWGGGILHIASGGARPVGVAGRPTSALCYQSRAS